MLVNICLFFVVGGIFEKMEKCFFLVGFINKVDFVFSYRLLFLFWWINFGFLKLFFDLGSGIELIIWWLFMWYMWLVEVVRIFFFFVLYNVRIGWFGKNILNLGCLRLVYKMFLFIVLIYKLLLGLR